MKANPLNLMLAENYTNQEPTGKMISEKLDGVFARWDGKNLYSKNGNRFNAPESVTRQLPRNTAFDCELWIGLGMLQATINAVKAGDFSQIKIMIIQLTGPGCFIERTARAKALRLPSSCELIPHTICTSKKHLKQFEEKVIKKGGEGVVLQSSDSEYLNGRTQNILKLKRRITEEARVTGYNGGHSKLFPVIESLICEYKGLTVNIGAGLTNLLKETPPEIGAMITFSFFGLTDSGQPREAAFVAVRDYE